MHCAPSATTTTPDNVHPSVETARGELPKIEESWEWQREMAQLKEELMLWEEEMLAQTLTSSG
ncbi:hypothetical protein Tco_1120362, partial [Tanacetum coccineum]